MKIRTSTIAALALTVAAIACGAPAASGDGASLPSSEVTAIRVVHDIRAATSLTVHLITPTGQEQRLGLLRPGGTDWFELDGPPLSGDYQLVAQLQDGRTYRSRPFILVGRAGVEWSPGDNIISPVGRE